MNHDRFLPNLIAIISICLVLVLWMIWFFSGQLAIYTTTVDYKIRDDGMLLGNFPTANLSQIMPGQQAELILPPQNGKIIQPIKGEVMNIPLNPGEPYEIFLFIDEISTETTKGQLKILLGKSSPAKMIWNSIQK